MGLPLLEAEEADTPIYTTSQGSFFVTADGVMDFATGTVTDSQDEAGNEAPEPFEDQPQDDQPVAEPVEVDPEVDDPEDLPTSSKMDLAVDEAKQFLRWLRKSPSRPFEFRHLPAAYAETLNKFITVQDYDGARWYAERYLA
jgi:hypothetical protein